MLFGVAVALLLTLAGLWVGVRIDEVIHHGPTRAVSVANATAPYAVVVAGFALLRRSWARAAVDAAVFFVSFVVGYYLDMVRSTGAATVNRHYAGAWLLIAALVCPILAAVLSWARHRRGVLSGIVFAVPAAAGLTEALTGRVWGMAASLPGVVIGVDLLVAAGYLLALPRGPLARITAVLAVTPITIALVTITGHLQHINAYNRWFY